MDPISFGATVGAVMELYEMGVLKKEQLGIEAPFGSAQGAHATSRRSPPKAKGFGKEIGQGSQAADCAKYGHPDLSMTRRRARSSRPTTRAASRAWAWPTPRPTAAPATCAATRWPPKCSASRSRPIRSVTEGKPELVKAFQDATAVFDSAGICIFTSFAWTLGRRSAADSRLRATDEFTLEKLSLIGERIWNMERDFNNRAGFTAKDDTLPKRLLTEPPRPARPRAWSTSLRQDAARVLRGCAAGTPRDSSKPETRARLGL